MKTPNSLEELMQSWTPRRPSPHIAEKLFGAEEQPVRAESRARRHGIRLPWYQTLGASLAACVVLVLTVANFSHMAASSSVAEGSGFSLSNNNCAATFAMASAPHNNLNAQILGWTNEGSSGSSNRSFDLLNTNSLLR